MKRRMSHSISKMAIYTHNTHRHTHTHTGMHAHNQAHTQTCTHTHTHTHTQTDTHTHTHRHTHTHTQTHTHTHACTHYARVCMPIRGIHIANHCTLAQQYILHRVGLSQACRVKRWLVVVHALKHSLGLEHRPD